MAKKQHQDFFFKYIYIILAVLVGKQDKWTKTCQEITFLTFFEDTYSLKRSNNTRFSLGLLLSLSADPLTAPVSPLLELKRCWNVERLERSKTLDLQVRPSTRCPLTDKPVFFPHSINTAFHITCLCSPRPPCPHTHSSNPPPTQPHITLTHTHTSWNVTHYSTHMRSWPCIIVMKTGKCRKPGASLNQRVCMCVCVWISASQSSTVLWKHACCHDKTTNKQSDLWSSSFF